MVCATIVCSGILIVSYSKKVIVYCSIPNPAEPQGHHPRGGAEGHESGSGWEGDAQGEAWASGLGVFLGFLGLGLIGFGVLGFWV